MVVSILGVYQSGGAGAPLHPEYPAERLRFMLEDSGAKILLCAERGRRTGRRRTRRRSRTVMGGGSGGGVEE